MKLNKISTSSKVTEIDAVTKQIVTLYEGSAVLSDQHLAAMMAELKQLSQKIASAIYTSVSESTLAEKDDARDEAVQNFNNYLKGLQYHPAQEVREAAGVVLALFNEFGIALVNAAYSVESSLIDSLLENLGTVEMQSEIAKLPGMAELVTAIAMTQQAFAEAYIAYTEQKVEEKKRVSATEIKREIVALINGKIVVYLRAMAIVLVADFGEFVGAVAEVVDDVNGTVKRR